MKASAMNVTPVPVSLVTLFWIFFRIACTGFGGFMALISVVQDAIVERRKLLSHQDMLDGISLASILPGPVAVNVMAYVGYRLRGGLGALVCVFAAVLPPFALIVAFSIAYFKWGQMPAVGKVFMGFVPAMAAVIAAAAWNMGRRTITSVREGVLTLAAAVALLSIGGFFSTLGIIVVAGVLGWWWFRKPTATVSSKRKPDKTKKKKSPRAGVHTNMLLSAALPAIAVPLTSFDPSLLLKLLVTFASMSLLLFGGGYVFIPTIQQIVVDNQGWVTQQEFVDAVAMGQVTPGPVLVSAAFIGMKVAGFAGAVVATVGIFTPSAILIALCSGLLSRIKNSPHVEAVLRGVRPAAIGMIAAAAIVVGKAAPPVWISAAIFAAALIALLRFRIDVVWIVPSAGVLGYLVY